MLSDLGLHELATSGASSSPTSASPRESELAYALLSACVVYEGVWTLYLGRPSSIPRSIMSVVALRCKAKVKDDCPWLNAWVGLCIPMAEASNVLNEHSSGHLERNTSLHQLIEDIDEWQKALPTELIYDETLLSSMNLAGYGLHTQYCKLQILLRQALANPSNSRKRRYSEITPAESTSQPSKDSISATYPYALRIARLVVTYREVFGMEKIPSIVLDNAVVAATAMIKHLSSIDSHNRAEREIMWLRQLLRSLESLQPHFPIVRRMLDSLRRMCATSSLSGVIPSPPQDSADMIREVPPLGQHAHLSTDDIETFGDVFGDEMDNTWKYFDPAVTAVDIPPLGVYDFLFHLPAAESLKSKIPQQVP